MKISYSNHFEKRAKKLFKKRPELKNKVQLKLKILEITPNHTSLELHKLKGEIKECWGITIEDNLRITFVYISEGILLVSIGSHDEVYK
jgi:addiction module RelE/StbE family toxin